MKRKFTVKPVVAAMTSNEVDEAILNNRPFNFKDYKSVHPDNYTEDTVYSNEVYEDDIIKIDYSAEQLNIGTIVKIVKVTESATGWATPDFHYTFLAEIQNDMPDQAVQPGDIVELHYDDDEAVGHIISYNPNLR